MTERESGLTLERAISEHEQLLVEFATSLQKHTIYPKGHPVVAASAERVHARLCEVLAERTTLSMGVARQRLVIEGESTDDSHPILRD